MHQNNFIYHKQNNNISKPLASSFIFPYNSNKQSHYFINNPIPIINKISTSSFQTSTNKVFISPQRRLSPEIISTPLKKSTLKKHCKLF